MISKQCCPGTIDFSLGEVILIDKPKGITSFDVIRQIRKFAGIVKIGHAGTLDPLASGLLILCTGSKTKIIDSFQSLFKVYTGEMFLGAKTPSYDLEKEPDAFFNIDMITEKEVLDNCRSFTGTIKQVPPVYSAIKYQGKAMYRHSRNGVEMHPEPREVTIYEFNIINIEFPYIRFYVKCSKGTYIRSLVHDFGKALNNGAYLSELRRTCIGDYEVKDAFTPDEFKEFLTTRQITAF